MTEHRFDYVWVEHEALTAFADLAREFCAVVERGLEGNRNWFATELHRTLARLYAAGLELPSTDILWDLDEDDAEEDEDEEGAEPYVYEPDPDRLSAEKLRDLHARLVERFGEANYYREVFDPYESPEQEEVTGSLADDVADIYQEVRGGLVKWDRGESADALWEWRFHLETHWGEHATGALRALHTRAAWRDGTWPAGNPNDGVRGGSGV